MAATCAIDNGRMKIDSSSKSFSRKITFSDGLISR
ncbi:hypothetical protein CCACVL1_21777 [Corchorus capsularis]|uniref:Uncharacterized protein n=1 Tax=Corchorus capsularis TaxID=210143 RepID=A0A1R3H251_COCAP|nr:hypothetical protein CCACVL1_21777 [Corchorus capsularis]